MTNAQIRNYAKANNISVQVARERIVKQADRLSKESFVDNDANFDWVEFDLISTLSSIMLITPSGISNEVEGVVNVQMFEPNQSLPKYAMNTSMCPGYVMARNLTGTSQKEYFLVMGKDTGYQAVFGFVCKKLNNELIQLLMSAALSRLPNHIKEFFYKNIAKAPLFTEKVEVLKANETHWGSVGIVQTIV